MPLGRWIALGGLAIAEIVYLSLRFDASTIGPGEEWWLRIFRHGFLPRLVITGIIAVGVFGSGQLRKQFQRTPALFVQKPPFFLFFFLGHLLGLGTFYLLTASLFEGSIRSHGHPVAILLGWGVAGLTMGLLWALALFPANLWRQLVRDGLPAVVAAAVVGAIGAMSYKVNIAWRPFSETTLSVVFFWLRMLGLDAVCYPSDLTVGTTDFKAIIGRDCSGYEGIGLILVFLSGYMWLFRAHLRFPRAFVLLPLATVLSWIGNTLRIAALICLGTWVSPSIAASGFHSQAGWLAFNGLALGLVLVTRTSPWFTTPEFLVAKKKGTNPAVPYLVPLLGIVAASMVTSAFAAGFDWLYPVRVVVASVCLWCFRQTYRQWRWNWSWAAAGVGAGVFAMWIGLAALTSDDDLADSLVAQHFQEVSTGLLVIWMVVRVIGAVVTVPLAEELAFRGYLARRLIASDFEGVPLGRLTLLSFLVSSVAFGVLHGQWFAGTLAGMAYALVLYRRGRISDAVLAHGTTNLLLAAYVLATGSWSLW